MNLEAGVEFAAVARGICSPGSLEMVRLEMTKDTKRYADAGVSMYDLSPAHSPRPTAHHFSIPDGAPACRLQPGGSHLPASPKPIPQPPDQRRHETFRRIFRVRCFMKHQFTRPFCHELFNCQRAGAMDNPIIPNNERTQDLLAKIFGIFQKVCKARRVMNLRLNLPDGTHTRWKTTPLHGALADTRSADTVRR